VSWSGVTGPAVVGALPACSMPRQSALRSTSSGPAMSSKIDSFPGRFGMLDALFWWTGVAMWAGFGIGCIGMAIVDAHDRSVLQRGH
jgi:hypothetical protein